MILIWNFFFECALYPRYDRHVFSYYLGCLWECTWRLYCCLGLISGQTHSEAYCTTQSVPSSNVQLCAAIAETICRRDSGGGELSILQSTRQVERRCSNKIHLLNPSQAGLWLCSILSHAWLLAHLLHIVLVNWYQDTKCDRLGIYT